jgi:hypothetical protein
MVSIFLSGVLGDAVNALLAAAAFNPKMRLNDKKELILFALTCLLHRINRRTLIQNY